MSENPIFATVQSCDADDIACLFDTNTMIDLFLSCDRSVSKNAADAVSEWQEMLESQLLRNASDFHSAAWSFYLFNCKNGLQYPTGEWFSCLGRYQGRSTPCFFIVLTKTGYTKHLAVGSLRQFLAQIQLCTLHPDYGATCSTHSLIDLATWLATTCQTLNVRDISWPMTCLSRWRVNPLYN